MAASKWWRHPRNHGSGDIFIFKAVFLSYASLKKLHFESVLSWSSLKTWRHFYLLRLLTREGCSDRIPSHSINTTLPRIPLGEIGYIFLPDCTKMYLICIMAFIMFMNIQMYNRTIILRCSSQACISWINNKCTSQWRYWLTFWKWFIFCSFCTSHSCRFALLIVKS